MINAGDARFAKKKRESERKGKKMSLNQTRAASAVLISFPASLLILFFSVSRVAA